MKLLNNRKTAIAITVVVAIFATLFGVHRSLNKLARDIEAMFYEEGYTATNLDAQLKKQAEAVLGIVTITGNYPELQKATEELRQARQELLSAGSISEKGYADLRMGFALEGMFTLGTQNEEGFVCYYDVELSEHDKGVLISYFEKYLGAGDVIDRGREMYNHRVGEFERGEAYSAIAGLLRPLVFVTPPELFINSQY